MAKDTPKVDQPASDPAAAESEMSTRPDGDSAEASEAPDEVEAGEETGMKTLVEDLHDRRRRTKLGGGEEKIALQHERGKLTARERLDLLVDPGASSRSGSTAAHTSPSARWRAGRLRPTE